MDDGKLDALGQTIVSALGAAATGHTVAFGQLTVAVEASKIVDDRGPVMDSLVFTNGEVGVNGTLTAQAAGTDDERKSARVIARSVISAYYVARKPAAGLPRGSSKTIELTLVRWPYT